MDANDRPPPAAPRPGPDWPPPAPLAAGLGLLQPLWLVLFMALLALSALAAGVRWLLVSEDGSRWLLAHAPGIEASGFRGALLGEHWQADRLTVRWADGQASLTLQDLRADGLTWRWRPHAQAWLGLDVANLAVRRAVLVSGPASAQPPQLPADLAWPLQLALAAARIDELQLDALAPMRQLQVQQLVLDPRPGTEHRVGRVRLDWQGTTLDGSARIGHAAPLPLLLDATLAPTLGAEAPAWAAVIRGRGTPDDIALAGTLRGVPRSGHAAPALDLQARLKPLAPWPLAALDLQTTALDLAALQPGLPQTRLGGSARIDSSARDAPLSARITLDNEIPGRWNEGRLPLRSLALEASGSLAAPDRLEIPRFDVALADAGAAAGRWRGSARWQAHELTLDTTLAGVTPQRLDGRAAAMTLTGPLAAVISGLPSPDPTAAAPAQPLRASVQLDLEGVLEAAPKPVRLILEGSADAQRIELRRARALAGAATADLQATLQRAGRGDWQLQTAGALANFDPVPWWPGDAGSAWRRGPHRLSGSWDLNLRLPGNAAGLPLPALLPRVAGNGTLRLADTVLAGVPLSATAVLGYAQPGAAAPATLRAELELGANRLLIDGRGDPTGSGERDRLDASVEARDLPGLAPLLRLLPDLAAWAPRRGSASARLSAEGRWPALRTEGSVSLVQLQAGRLGVERGSLDWRVDLDSGTRPLSLQLDLAALQLGETKADRLRGQIGGTLAEHRIELSGDLPLVPPAMAERVLGVTARDGTRLQLLAQGAWLADPAGGGRWRAQVERLRVSPQSRAATATAASSAPAPASATAPAATAAASPAAAPGTAAANAAGPAWAEVGALRAELGFAADGRLLDLRADAGRLRLADTLALRWDEVRIDLREALPRIDLRADIEAFALAPLLARLQPGRGWQGDLRLGARIDIRAAERFDADLVFERRDGDLHLADGTGTQLLGLSELRLALNAHDGLWSFRPTLKGRSLGEIDGQLQVRTTPERRWPERGAPVSGAAQARVADLGIWSAWVPPGWRLAGEVRGTATLGGSFGDPRFTGEVSGSGLAVRNLLQGVNVSDGEVAIRLEGDSARIERFTLRGGDGRLTLSGGATLGSQPQARLRLDAERFRVLGRVDRLVIASGQAELTLQQGQSRLDGRFAIDEGLIDVSRADAPSLDDDVTVRRAGDPEPAARAEAQPGTARNFALGVDVDLGSALQLRGRGLDTRLAGQLRLTAPAGRLAIVGTIRSEQGTYAAYGQRLAIERGIVAFSGSVDNPRLDVLAIRPDIDARVGVAISGNLLTPRVRLFAEPELSDNEKLSWLVLGRAPDGLGRTDTALLQRAAVALLAGEGEAPTDALLRNLGIDELSLKQGEGDVRDTVISLGKQLSRRWYVGYERGVNATTGTWQLIYRIAQRFTLRAQSGLDNSLDIIWTWRFQETPADAGMRKSIVVPP